MGKGEHNTRLDGTPDEQFDSTTLSTQHRLPTLSEIKVKVPAHCFRPTVRESMSYVVKDIFYVALTVFLMYQLNKSFQYGFLFFPLYWYIQGLFQRHFFSDKRTFFFQFRNSLHVTLCAWS